ncbi:MAG TPA: SPFH domain-containing protein [Thermomicrobiales bacterium]|nr:SPFH domain-containing protein [Thermomicrobiales bacterium]
MGPIVIAVLAVVVVLVILATFASMFRKVGPNQALIVYGFGGTHIVQGGGAIILPLVQNARELSLELMSFDVAPQQDLYTNQGVAVNVEAVAQIKIKSDPASIRTASEQFLSKPPQAREALIRLVMEGHLRGIVGQLTVESLVKEPEMVADRVRSNVASDMDKMGLEVVSFTIREVRDKNEYIGNMGKPDIARIKREADIAAAEAERDTAIKRAQAMREAAIAQAAADQERVIAQTASETKQAEAVRDLNLKKAQYDATVKSQQAQTDKAYDIQANIMQQQVIAEQVRVQRVEKDEQVKVQEAEIARREKELIATVLKPAEMDRQRIETLAAAERQRLALEAQGRAEAEKSRGFAEAEINKAKGQADADVIRLRGSAEAEIIRAKGESEAEAMQVKADAYANYNQAAILDRLLGSMPELARAMSEPLSKVDKITVVSTGGDGIGTNQVIGDIARMIAQAPALFEGLTGMKLGDLMQHVPALGEAVTRANRANGKAAAPAADDGDRPYRVYSPAGALIPGDESRPTSDEPAEAAPDEPRPSDE